MKFLFLFLVVTQVFGSDLGNAFYNIIEAQSNALIEMDKEAQNLKAHQASGFQMNEMIMDLGITHKGILGVSSLNSKKGMEIRWKRERQVKSMNDDTAGYLIESDISSSELNEISKSIAELVERSGKVRKNQNLTKNIFLSLSKIQQNLNNIHITNHQAWKLEGMRLDLLFGVNGEVWFFTKLGVKFRVRIDWKIKEKFMTSNKSVLVNNQTKFVAKTLEDLNKSLAESALPGYYLRRISIGIGLSRKSGFFGIWNYAAGFLGFLQFAPIAPSLARTKSTSLELPIELAQEDYQLVGGEDDYVTTKGWRFWRIFLKRNQFQSGLKKSLNSAALFAEKALKIKNSSWYISDIKTFINISKSGLFGLSSVTSSSVIELDFNRL